MSTLNQKSKKTITYLLLFFFLIIIVILTVISQKKPLTPPPSSSSLPSKPSSFNLNLKPFQLAHPQLSSSNQIISIDTQTSQLIQVTNDQITAITSKPVLSFSYNHPLIAYIESQNQNQLKIINLDTQKTSSYSVVSIAPIFDVSLTQDNLSAYLIGNLNPLELTTTIYSLNLANSSLNTIYQGQTTNLKTLTDHLLLFTYSDAVDLSQVIIYHPDSHQKILNQKANIYFISPDQNSVALFNSDQIIIFNLLDQSKKTFSAIDTVGGYWTNNQTFYALKNSANGVQKAIITPLSESLNFSTIKELEAKSIFSVIGVINHQVFLTDRSGNIISIPTD